MEKQLDQSTHFVISSNISEIYKCTPEILETEHIPRYQKFIADFHNLYNINPKFIVRAPGRVNLIGEHIDYAGYGVLPMALEQDAIIAFTPTEDSELEVNHVLSALYPSHKLPVDPSQSLKDEKSYINYFIAGYKAGLSNTNLEKYSGIKVLISGNLLQEAGLSSSSSFIVSVGLMALVANGLAEKTDKKEFIENAVKCERLVGTAGGGMDQTISVLAETGKAFYIQFNPLNLTPVELPSGYCFVVSNSLTPSPKVLTLGTRYNKRVVECRFALKILMKELKTEKASEIKNFKQLQDFLKLSFDEMIKLVQKYLKEEPYTIKQIEDSIGETASKAISDIQNSSVVLESNTEYFLYQRAKHVFSEAARVIAFKEVCQSDIPPEQKGIKLGDLMNHSHYSCRDLYDCSSEQLDELTTLCRGLGASGSRVTGAGWGGCCVSLIKENKAMVFLHELNLQYYGKKDDESHVAEDLRTDVFASCPSSGAGILNVDQEKWF